MPIGAGGTLGAMLLGVALGATAVVAQTPAGGTWTDPPARSAPPAAAAVVPPAPAAAGSAGKASEIGPGASKGGTVAEGKPSVVPAPTPRRAARRDAGPIGEARRARARIVADAPPARIVRPRAAARREAVRPAPRPVAARSFATRSYAAGPYALDPRPMPAGRVHDGAYGERNPIFDEGDDRTHRIAAAQAAGYLVVRARSVQFPDGRMLRAYRPYEGEDGLD